MMITRFASLTSRLSVGFAILFMVAACGGGGSSNSDIGFIPDTDSDDTYYLALTLQDSNGNPTSSVSSSSPATFTVRVTKNKQNGAAIANVVVTAEATAGILSPANALTNSNGVATFRLGAETSSGAGTITANVEGPSGPVTASLSFQIGNSGLRLGYLDSDGDFIENEIGIEPDSVLASQAVAQLSLVILDENGDLASSAETVSFSSGCIAAGQATLDPASPLVSGDGKINTSYTAQGCSGNDNITATLEGSAAQAFGTLSIASAQANGFNFISAEPATIVLRGTGGGSAERSESSKVTFKVVDSNNGPLAGIKVDFSLTTDVGGLSLSPTSAVSGSDGLVSVNVSSGDIATVVRVIATSSAGDGSGQQVSSVSDILTVSTGLPDQNSISLSVGAGGFVIEDGFTMDGVARTITVRMADKFNNPVPDGTAAVFTTEYGAIDPACETTDGACDVTWNSQAPRYPTLTGTDGIQQIYDNPGYSCPSHNGNEGPCPDDLGYIRGGRSTVVVTAIGEESFIDRNGNGIMDENERDLFDNLPEAFLDNNEDGIFNPATSTCQGAGATTSQCIAGQEEIFVDFNGNGKYDLNDNPAVYNGLLCPIEGDGVWCSRSLVNVRDDLVLILSAESTWGIGLYQGRSPVSVARWNGGVYTAYISDIYNNRPPEGSTITLTSDGACEILGETSFTVANTTAYGAVAVSFEIGGQGDQGTVDITLAPTDGTPYTRSFTCVPEPDPEPEPEPEPGEAEGGLGLGG
jgi:hypothetical protein